MNESVDEFRKSKATKPIELTGKFSPFEKVSQFLDQPIYVEMPNINARWVVVYSKVEDLQEFMCRSNIKDYKIKLIEDGIEFSQSIFENGLRIMLDPRVIDNQKTKWTEVVSESNV